MLPRNRTEVRENDSHMSDLLWSNKTIWANKSLSSCSHTLLTVGSQRNISQTSMATIKRPLRLAMANKENARGRHDLVLSDGLDGSREAWPEEQ